MELRRVARWALWAVVVGFFGALVLGMTPLAQATEPEAPPSTEPTTSEESSGPHTNGSSWF